MADANLLITYDPCHSSKAEDEVKALLKSVGEAAKFLKSDIEGIFLLVTKKDTRTITKELRKSGKANPTQFVYTYHWAPVDKWVKTDLAVIGKVMKTYDKKLDPKKSWKLDLAKRHYDKASMTDLILKLTEHIDKPKVDLVNPQVIVAVEILGKKTGLALLEADEIIDSTKLK